jgi:hypothetical protein
LAAATLFTPGTAAIWASYEFGILKARLTLWRVTSLVVPCFRKPVIDATKVCNVQNKKMHIAIATAVVLVRIQLRRKCLNINGKNLILRLE